MTTTDEQYVPDEEQVRAWCRESTGDYPDVMNEWLDRFLARVRRDAERDAVLRLRDHLAESRGYNLIGPEGLDHYIRREHPEETA